MRVLFFVTIEYILDNWLLWSPSNAGRCLQVETSAQRTLQWVCTCLLRVVAMMCTKNGSLKEVAATDFPFLPFPPYLPHKQASFQPIPEVPGTYAVSVCKCLPVCVFVIKMDLFLLWRSNSKSTCSMMSDCTWSVGTLCMWTAQQALIRFDKCGLPGAMNVVNFFAKATMEHRTPGVRLLAQASCF